MAGSYPSFEERYDKRERLIFNDAFNRLYWPLDGSFPDAFRVMRTQRSANEVMEPLRQADGTWHEVALLAITEPKVSSIVAKLPMLDEYEGGWVSKHMELCENCEYEPFEDREMNDDGNWEKGSESAYLIRCCGQDRPRNKSGRKVTVLPSDGSDFVTIRDYLETVHAWLKSQRDDIAGAMYVSHLFAVGKPEHSYQMEWMVDKTSFSEHRIEEKKQWQRNHEPVGPPSASTLRIVEQERQRRAKAREILQKQDEARTEEQKREDEKMTPEEWEERTRQMASAIYWTLP